MAQSVKNLATVQETNGREGDLGIIPSLGRSPVKEMATHSSVQAWESPWTEEPFRLQSMGLQELGMT